jgi:hypothetical protein
MSKDYMAKNDFSGKKNLDGYFHKTPHELGLDALLCVTADLLNGGTGGMFRCKHYGPYGHPKFGKRITACWWVPDADAPVVVREPDYKFEEWK